MTIYVALIGTCTRLSTLAPIQPSTCFTWRPQIMSLPGKQCSPSHKSPRPFPTAALKEAPSPPASLSGRVRQTEVTRPVHLSHLVRDGGETTSRCSALLTSIRSNGSCWALGGLGLKRKKIENNQNKQTTPQKTLWKSTICSGGIAAISLAFRCFPGFSTLTKPSV